MNFSGNKIFKSNEINLEKKSERKKKEPNFTYVLNNLLPVKIHGFRSF